MIQPGAMLVAAAFVVAAATGWLGGTFVREPANAETRIADYRTCAARIRASNVRTGSGANRTLLPAGLEAQLEDGDCLGHSGIHGFSPRQISLASGYYTSATLRHPRKRLRPFHAPAPGTWWSEGCN